MEVLISGGQLKYPVENLPLRDEEGSLGGECSYVCVTRVIRPFLPFFIIFLTQLEQGKDLLGKRRWSGELGLSDEEVEWLWVSRPGVGGGSVDVSRLTRLTRKLWMFLLLLGFLTFTWKSRFPGHSHSLFVFAVFSPPGPSRIPESKMHSTSKT